MNLNEITHFLPYELKVKNGSKISTITGAAITQLGTVVYLNGSITPVKIESVKPLVRPLSALFQEKRIKDKVTTYIQEVFKDEFMGKCSVKEIMNKGRMVVYVANFSDMEVERYVDSSHNFSNTRLLYVERLAAFHFDLFGWLEKGLAEKLD